MSFEGYYQWRCTACGNSTERDVYDVEPGPECDMCGGKWTHMRLVDQTNDPEYIGDWMRIDGRKQRRDTKPMSDPASSDYWRGVQVGKALAATKDTEIERLRRRLAHAERTVQGLQIAVRDRCGLVFIPHLGKIM